MQYLLEDARLLFTVLLISSAAILVFLFSMAYKIIARIKARKEASAQAPTRDEEVSPRICCPGQSTPCRPAGACTCK